MFPALPYNFHQMAGWFFVIDKFFLIANKRFLAMINEHSNVINVWDFTSQKLFSHMEFGTVFSQMKWSPDGAYLAVSSDK